MWTKSRSLLLSRVMTLFFIVVLAGGSCFLPQILRWYMTYIGKPLSEYPLLRNMVWACAVPAFAALMCLLRLLGNIRRGEVFTSGNVSMIRAVSWCCFAVSAVLLVFGFYFVTMFLISALAAFGGLILRVVKNVFAEAVYLKNENDLTV